MVQSVSGDLRRRRHRVLTGDGPGRAFVLSGGTGGPGTATRVLPLAMYITGFQAHDMGRASAVATLLVVFGLGLSLLTTRLSGFTRMDSQQEGM